MQRLGIGALAVALLTAAGCTALYVWGGSVEPQDISRVADAPRASTTLPGQTMHSPLDVPGWATTTDSGAVFLYPEKLPAKYVHAAGAWPPLLALTDGPFACSESTGAEGARFVTKKISIEDREYCVITSVEGAAGSTYTSYAYSFPWHGRVGLLRFTVREVQCDNFDEPERATCMSEQTTLNIDEIADKIARSIRE